MNVVVNIITAGVVGKLNLPGSCHIWFVGSTLSLNYVLCIFPYSKCSKISNTSCGSVVAQW